MSDESTDSRPGVFGAPAAVGTAVPMAVPSVASHLDLGGGTSGSRVARRYSANATSPLIHLAVAAVACLVALLTVRWFVQADSSADGGPSDYQWGLLTSVAFGPDGPARFDGAGHAGAAGWWAVAALLVAAAALVAWFGRLGSNCRYGHGSFGAGLALVALPSWWALAGVLDNNDAPYDLSEMKARTFLLALGLVLQALGARWLFTHRLWNAGNLPRPELSLVLWVPHLVTGFLVWGAYAFAYLTYDENKPFDPAWEPTELTERAAQWGGRGTAIAVLVVGIVVSVRQHQLIAQDKADHDADLEERRLAATPLPGAAAAPQVRGGAFSPR